MKKPILNENLKTILTAISIIIILFSLIGNYYVEDYRLNQVEKGAQDREHRLQFLEKQMIEINVKLDILLEHSGLTNQYKNYRTLRGGK